jgi:hypothetical protein
VLRASLDSNQCVIGCYQLLVAAIICKIITTHADLEISEMPSFTQLHPVITSKRTNLKFPLQVGVNEE